MIPSISHITIVYNMYIFKTQILITKNSYSICLDFLSSPNPQDNYYYLSFTEQIRELYSLQLFRNALNTNVIIMWFFGEKNEMVYLMCCLEYSVNILSLIFPYQYICIISLTAIQYSTVCLYPSLIPY